MSEDVKRLDKMVSTPIYKSSTPFQKRLEDVTEILNEFQKTLDLFKDGQLDKLTDLPAEASTLPAELEKEDKEQILSYQGMISGIHDSISHIQDEVESIEISTAVLLRSMKNIPDQNVFDTLQREGKGGFDHGSNIKKMLTLEERVLQYIDQNRNGIKISDMESPFGETRMRIGFVVKKLLDEEKIQKVDSLYFPIY